MFESCMKCVAPKRRPGCHSTCEEYKKDKEMLDRRKNKIHMEKDKERMVIECEIAAKDANIRRKCRDNLRKKYKREY